MFGRKKEKEAASESVTLRKEVDVTAESDAGKSPGVEKVAGGSKFKSASGVFVTSALIVAAVMLLQALVQFFVLIEPLEDRAASQRVEQAYQGALSGFNRWIDQWQQKVGSLAALPGAFNAVNNDSVRNEWNQQLHKFYGEVAHSDLFALEELRASRSERVAGLSFASQDMLRRIAQGEKVLPEAFLKEGRWFIQFVAPVNSAPVAGVESSMAGVLLVVFDVGLLTDYVKTLGSVAPGAWAIRQSLGGEKVISGMEGSGPAIERKSRVSHWSLAFWPESANYRTSLDAMLFWLLSGVCLVAACGLVILPMLVFLKRLRAESIVVTGFLQQVLQGDKRRAPSIAVDVLHTLMVTLQRVILANEKSHESELKEARQSAQVSGAASDKGRSSQGAAPASPPASESVSPLFQDTDPLDIDDMFGDDETSLGDSVAGDDAEDLADLGDLNELAPLAVNVSRSIFRAYDIRGIVGETITPEVATQIGLAFGSEAQAKGVSSVCVGFDGRISSPMLAESLIAGILQSGCHVQNVGSVPTPVLYFATHHLKTGSGVMVTGSHNPANYNGFKMMIAGETLATDAIQKLYQRIDHQNFATGMGEAEKVDVSQHYLNAILNDVAVAAPLKVVVDAGNGIAGVLGPRLIEELGCEVIPLYCEVDGRFPNHHPDPGKPENLAALMDAVAREDADLGIAFDGDGDRIGVVTNRGKIIWPDRLLMLFAKDVVSRNPGADVLYDVKCTRRLNALISGYGGRPVMWKSGHSLMKAKMRETGALLAGEMSGHIFFKERWLGFDDGIYSAARLLEILGLDERSSDEVFASFPEDISTPELNLPVSDEGKFAIVEKLATQGNFDSGAVSTIDGVRVDFADGWGLCRASNTTPVLVLRFEADNDGSLERIKQVFREQLRAVDSSLDINF